MGQNSLHILDRWLCNLASGGFLHHIYRIFDVYFYSQKLCDQNVGTYNIALPEFFYDSFLLFNPRAYFQYFLYHSLFQELAWTYQ